MDILKRLSVIEAQLQALLQDSVSVELYLNLFENLLKSDMLDNANSDNIQAYIQNKNTSESL